VADEPGQIAVEDEGGAWVVRVLGEHDLTTREPLATELERVTAGGGHVVVDLTGTDFMDSTILGVLLGGHARAAANDGTYAFVAPSGGRPRRLLELTRVADRIPVFETRSEALSSRA
jgi:anti-sigma B factor antagonist